MSAPLPPVKTQQEPKTGPTSSQPRLSVFICYSRKRREFAVRLQDGLEKAGMDVWIDLDDILPTETWSEVVEHGIEQADVFLFLISPESIVSKVCLRELEHAIDLKKKLVPILLAEASPVPPSVASIHFNDFTRADDFDQALERLIWALTTDLEWLRAHTRFLNQALAWERSGQRRSKLIWGRSLREAEAWLAADKGKETQATALHRRFIEASRKFVQKLVALAAVIAVLAVGTVSAFALYSRAVRAAQLAIDLASVAESSDDIQLATLLGAEAVMRTEEIEWPWRTSEWMSRLREKTRESLRRTVSLWARRLNLLDLQGAWPDSVSFNPEGDIAAVLADNAIRLWRWSPERSAVAGPWSLEGEPTAMTFTADGTRIATGGNATTISLYDARAWIAALRSGEQAEGLPNRYLVQRLDCQSDWGEEDLVGLAACSDSSGEYLAAGLTGTRDAADPRHRFLVWKKIGSEYQNPVEIPQGRQLISLAVSADCRFLATVAFVQDDPVRQARVFKSQTPRTPNIFEALKGGRADDVSLLRGTGDRDGPPSSLTAEFSPSSDPGVTVTRGNSNVVTLSPDGRLFAIAETNSDPEAEMTTSAATYVGDRATRQEKTRLSFQALVGGLAFNRDNRLATAAWDGTTQVWEVDLGVAVPTETDALLEKACGFLESNLTREQWGKYFPGKSPRKTCPKLP